jgi:hypothetical protein
LYAGVPGLQGVDRGHRAHLGRGCEPAGRANFLASHSVILSFYSAVDGGPRELSELKVRKLEMSMAGPLGVLAAGSATATTKVEDVDGGLSRGAGDKVRQQPPPKLKTSMVGPLGRAGDRSDSSHL